MTVTKDTKIFDILQESRETAPFFLEMGMHCLGCPSARNETLGPVSYTHLDVYKRQVGESPARWWCSETDRP